MATNVVLVLVLVLVLGVVVIRFSIAEGSVVSRPIVVKLFTLINDNILHQATVAMFSCSLLPFTVFRIFYIHGHTTVFT